MDLFEEIRREYEFGAGTIAGMARQFGVHRRLIREALASAVPKESAGRGWPRPRIALDAGPRADREKQKWDDAHRRVTFYCPTYLLDIIEAEMSNSRRSKSKVIVSALLEHLTGAR